MQKCPKRNEENSTPRRSDIETCEVPHVMTRLTTHSTPSIRAPVQLQNGVGFDEAEMEGFDCIGTVGRLRYMHAEPQIVSVER